MNTIADFVLTIYLVFRVTDGISSSAALMTTDPAHSAHSVSGRLFPLFYTFTFAGS
jgi:hypothetical protein